jgi:hypothetical protein
LLGGTPSSPDAAAAVTQEALPNKMADASMKDKTTTMTADGGSNMAMPASEVGAERTMPASPRTSSATATTTNVVTPEQVAQLESLLSHHYQLLVQQSILAVRAASYSKAERTGASSGSGSISNNTVEDAIAGMGGKQGKAARGKSLKQQSNHHSSSAAVNDFYCGETADDLAEILDGAVGMLQDLDQVCHVIVMLVLTDDLYIRCLELGDMPCHAPFFVVSLCVLTLCVWFVGLLFQWSRIGKMRFGIRFNWRREQ